MEDDWSPEQEVRWDDSYHYMVYPLARHCTTCTDMPEDLHCDVKQELKKKMMTFGQDIMPLLFNSEVICYSRYPDVKVRGFAVDCLRKMPTDALIDFIPQLIQVTLLFFMSLINTKT